VDRHREDDPVDRTDRRQEPVDAAGGDGAQEPQADEPAEDRRVEKRQHLHPLAIVADGLPSTAEGGAIGCRARLTVSSESPARATLCVIDLRSPARARTLGEWSSGCWVFIGDRPADLEATAVGGALDPLARQGLAVEGNGAAFSHPIVRAALYQELSPFARTQRHARAATILQRAGRPADEVVGPIGSVRGFHTDGAGVRATSCAVLA
jgi:hypothetical protein